VRSALQIMKRASAGNKCFAARILFIIFVSLSCVRVYSQQPQSHVNQVIGWIESTSPWLLNSVVLPKLTKAEREAVGNVSLNIKGLNSDFLCSGPLQTAQSHRDKNDSWEVDLCARPLTYLLDFVMDLNVGVLPISWIHDPNYPLARAQYIAYMAHMDWRNQAIGNPPQEPCTEEAFAYEYFVKKMSTPCQPSPNDSEKTAADKWYWSKAWATSDQSRIASGFTDSEEFNATVLDQRQRELGNDVGRFLLAGIFAHEIAHGIRHDDTKSPSAAMEERADEFAYNVLSRSATPEILPVIIAPYILTVQYVSMMNSIENSDPLATTTSEHRVNTGESAKFLEAERIALVKFLSSLTPEQRRSIRTPQIDKALNEIGVR